MNHNNDVQHEWLRLLARRGIGRRAFLRNALGGATALALGGGTSGLLTGCGSGKSGELANPTPIGAGTRLLVSTFLNETLEQFRAQDGSPLPTLVRSQGSGITMAGTVVTAGNNVFIFSPAGNKIFLCNATTGAVKRVITGLFTPHNGSIGPDGHLYAVNAPSLNFDFGVGTDTVEKIDAQTGDRLGTFCEVRAPFGIVWGPDGNLYVSSTFAYLPFPSGSDYISRFDGRTGRFIDTFVREIKVPFNMAFHPNGDLLVIQHFAGLRGSDFVGRINIHDKTTGKLKETFADVDFPIGLVYGPDGHLYVSSFTDNAGFTKILNNDTEGAKGKGRVLKFDGQNGKPLGDVVSGLSFAGYITFAS